MQGTRILCLEKSARQSIHRACSCFKIIYQCGLGISAMILGDIT